MAIIFGSLTYDLSLVLLLLFIWAYYVIKKKQDYFKHRDIPYVKSSSLVLDMIGTIIGKNPMFGRQASLYNELEGNRFGGFFTFGMPIIMIRDPELVDRILVKDFVHFHNRWYSPSNENDHLLLNLFNLEGQRWRHLRYRLTPTFTTGKLKGMFEQICNCGENIAKNIEKETKIDKDINTEMLLKNFALDVIASCAFGIQLDEDDSMKNRFQRMMQGVVKPSSKQMFKFMLMLNMPKICAWLGIKGTEGDTEEFVLGLVSETLKLRKEGKVVRNDFLQLMYSLQKNEESGVNSEDDKVEHDDVIDQLEHAGGVDRSQMNHKVFTDECIAAQSFVFLLAGTESVSGTLGYVLYSLAQNPSVQQKLQEEISSVLNSRGHKWNYEAVKQMTYLDNVIQETQRKYPTVQELQRICTEPYKIPDSDTTIEKGTKVMIPVYCIQNDPDNYSSPETFDPDRFADNNFKPSGIYLPFGNGPRICIAMRFALLELKVCVARIVHEYKVVLSPKTQLPLKQDPRSMVLSPVGGFWFEFHKRI